MPINNYYQCYKSKAILSNNFCPGYPELSVHIHGKLPSYFTFTEIFSYKNHDLCNLVGLPSDICMYSWAHQNFNKENRSYIMRQGLSNWTIPVNRAQGRYPISITVIPAQFTGLYRQFSCIHTCPTNLKMSVKETLYNVKHADVNSKYRIYLPISRSRP